MTSERINAVQRILLVNVSACNVYCSFDHIQLLLFESGVSDYQQGLKTYLLKCAQQIYKNTPDPLLSINILLASSKLHNLPFIQVLS